MPKGTPLVLLGLFPFGQRVQSWATAKAVKKGKKEKRSIIDN
jgi:hypothetical protein